MSYEVFQKRVNALVDRMKGSKPTVNFRHDAERGKHYANFSDGTTIIGNTVAKNVMVQWGSGHRATTTI
jgi:hypothetical protein